MKYKDSLSSLIGHKVDLVHQNGLCYLLDVNNQISFSSSTYSMTQRFTLAEVGDDFVKLTSEKGNILIPLEKAVVYTKS